MSVLGARCHDGDFGAITGRYERNKTIEEGNL